MRLLHYLPAIIAAASALAGGVAVVRRKRRKPTRRQRVAVKVQQVTAPVRRVARKAVASPPVKTATKAAAWAAHTLRVKAARALLRGGWSMAGPRR